MRSNSAITITGWMCARWQANDRVQVDNPGAFDLTEKRLYH